MSISPLPALAAAYDHLAAAQLDGKVDPPEYLEIDGTPGIQLRVVRDLMIATLRVTFSGSQLKAVADIQMPSVHPGVNQLTQDLMKLEAELARLPTQEVKA